MRRSIAGLACAGLLFGLGTIPAGAAVETSAWLVTQSPNVATANRAERYTLKLRLKPNIGTPAKLVIKGPKKYKKKLGVERKTKIRGLRAGTYRVKAKTVQGTTRTYRADTKNHTVQLAKKRKVKLVIRYRTSDPQPPVSVPEKVEPVPPTGSVPQPAPTSVEAEVLRLTNVARASAQQCGEQWFTPAAPLKLNTKLQKAARLHSQDMRTNNFFRHTNPAGQLFSDRIKAVGYDYSWAAENIAAGQATPKAVTQGWLASPGHCRNIMNPNLRDLGVGFASGGSFGSYWTQKFAAPSR